MIMEEEEEEEGRYITLSSLLAIFLTRAEKRTGEGRGRERELLAECSVAAVECDGWWSEGWWSEGEGGSTKRQSGFRLGRPIFFRILRQAILFNFQAVAFLVRSREVVVLTFLLWRQRGPLLAHDFK